MNLEDLTDALYDLGINYEERGKSLVIQDCPACGSKNWKVHLRIDRYSEDEPFMGRCYSGKCQTNFSSFSYLLAAGLDYLRTSQIHGRDPNTSLAGLAPSAKEPAKEKKAKPKAAEKCDTDISGFFKLSDWANHPAALYAKRRGVMPGHDMVMIDPISNAVVFVVKDAVGSVLGYQRRFLNPVSPNMKTKTSVGFEKTKHILHIPRANAKICVCEGPFTAIAAWNYGYYAVCTFGSGVSEEQIKLIAELADKLSQDVGVSFDLDDAGAKGLARIRGGLFWAKKETFLVLPEEGNDLNDSWMAGKGCREIRGDWGGPAIPAIKSFLP